MGDPIAIAGLILGVLALPLAVAAWLDTKAIRRQLLDSSGQPTVDVRWGNASSGVLTCSVTAHFNPVSVVKLRVGNETKTIPRLQPGEPPINLEFGVVPEGTTFKLTFTDPVEGKTHRRKDVVRYEQAMLM